MAFNVYRSCDVSCDTHAVRIGNGSVEVVYTPEGGSPQRIPVFEFKNGGGVSLCMYNTDEVRQLKLMSTWRQGLASR